MTAGKLTRKTAVDIKGNMQLNKGGAVVHCTLVSGYFDINILPTSAGWKPLEACKNIKIYSILGHPHPSLPTRYYYTRITRT